MPNIS